MNKEKMIEELNKIIDNIENGVVTPDGNIRPYDILDYYQNEYINKENDIYKNINIIRNDISKEQVIKFKRFIDKNPVGERLDHFTIKNIFSTNDEVNVKRDESGKLIPGTGRIITPTEKKEIFDYILENNLPLTSKIYSLALKRYLNNELVFEEKTHKL